MVADAAALIRAKRDGRELDRDALRAVAEGIADGRWCDGQVAAWAMAVAWRGMSVAECTAFTQSLCAGGRRFCWQALPGPVVDKHSTGGVGDGVSLLLAPLLAACGAFVPMISGRGLGHTGGTLDKLESLAGCTPYVSAERLHRIVREVGCAIVGADADLAPADRRLYAIRDVTATVDVPDLIVASILGKKLAGGARHLVIDVKVGSGAQTPDEAAAIALAGRLSSVAAQCDLPLAVGLSDMGQVLGRHAGNALELQAAIDLLSGRGGCPRLLQLTLALAARLLCMGGLCDDDDAAQQRLQRALASGAAAERFARMIAALGGPGDVLAQPHRHLPQAPVRRAVASARSGHVQAIDVRALGECVVDLGGGRRRAGQAIDAAVGLAEVLGRGEHVDAGQALAIVHARDDAAAARAVEAVRAAFEIGDEAPPALPLLRWLDAPAAMPAPAGSSLAAAPPRTVA